MTSHAATHTGVVVPAGGRRETLWVAAVLAAIVAAMTVFAQFNAQKEHQYTLSDWQLSAFYDLNATDQAIYNALYAAAETLWVNYEFEKQWTSIEDLEFPDYGVAPFAKDVSWKQTGGVQWSLIKTFSFEGATAYFGNRGSIAEQGAYLLILGHAHKGASYNNQSTVWLHPDRQVEAPATIVRESLIRNGWREVVPYSGTTELRRLGRGE